MCSCLSFCHSSTSSSESPSGWTRQWPVVHPRLFKHAFRCFLRFNTDTKPHKHRSQCMLNTPALAWKLNIVLKAFFMVCVTFHTPHTCFRTGMLTAFSSHTCRRIAAAPGCIMFLLVSFTPPAQQSPLARVKTPTACLHLCGAEPIMISH